MTRDIPLITVLSLSILFFGINWKHPKWPGAIQRKEGRFRRMSDEFKRQIMSMDMPESSDRKTDNDDANR